MAVIITHDHGDFDALAAAVAASKLYPGSVIAMPEPLHANVRAFINLKRDLLPLLEGQYSIEKPALVVVVDTRQKRRLGRYLKLVDRAEGVRVYDHHPPGPDDLVADVARIDPVGATTTLLVEEIHRKGIPLTELEATLMLLGIYEDTGCLTYSSTTSRDAAAAAFLWKHEINAEMLQEYLRHPLSESQKALLEKLLEGSELYELHRRRVLFSGAALEEYVHGAAALFHYLQETGEADVAVMLVEMGDGVYLAARSTADDINLLDLLAPFSVKGHGAAVSASLKGDDLAVVKEELLEQLKKYLPPAATGGEIASFPVETLESGTSASQALNFLYDKDIGGCPVTEEEQVVGMISRRDLQKAMRSELGHAPVRGFMRRQIITASVNDSVTTLRRQMVEHNIGRLPVINDKGELEGIVTRSDILRTLYRLDRRGKVIREKNYLINVNQQTTLTDVDNVAHLIRQTLPLKVQSLLLTIGQKAEQAEVEVYLVGGTIRDLLLGHRFSRDLDFVVVPDAIAFAGELEKMLGGKLKVFEQFGTASLFLDGGLRLDLVTARREFYAAPATLPQVENSSLKQDLYRRDFTINTLACSLQPDSFGLIYDYFEGREDMGRGIIRTLYNLSFVDDPLRILRAARFEQRFGFTIEENTMDLIKKAVKSKVLDKLSRQRLHHEASLIYQEPTPAKVLKRLHEMGVLSYIYSRVNPSIQTFQRLYAIGEVLAWANMRDWPDAPDPELVYLCGLLLDLESEERSAIMRRLQFSKERTDAVLSTCKAAPQTLSELSEGGGRPSAVVNRLDPFPVEGLLFMLALTTDTKVKGLLKLYLDSLRHVRPRLRGNDLKKLGLQPGPLYGTILQKLREAVLDGKVRSPREELDYIRSYLEQIPEKEEG